MRVTSSLLMLFVGLALAGGAELSAQAGSGPDSADPEAMALVDAWIESVGGMETYAGFHSARYPSPPSSTTPRPVACAAPARAT